MTIQWRPIAASPLEAALYDGTNGADIVAGLTGSTFTSDAGGVLDFVDHQPVPQQYTAPWMLFRNGDGTFGGANDPATMFNYHDLAQIVADWAPIPGFVQSSGSEPVPASLLGQTADYDVTMSPALPDASYVPVAPARLATAYCPDTASCPSPSSTPTRCACPCSPPWPAWRAPRST